MDLTRLMEMSCDELRQSARMEFKLLPNIPSLLSDFAQSIASEIQSNNALGEPTRLILPVGPVAQYPILCEITQRQQVSWKNVWVFAMDEFLDWQGRPIPVSHPLSFEGFLRRELLSKVDIPDQQCVFPHPFRIDEASEIIRKIGGIDACYGGVGYHGHVAFNEPPISRWHKISVGQMRESLTRVVTLSDDSIVVQSIHSSGGNSAAIPPMAVTLGMRDIIAARKIRLYCASGERHRAIFRIAAAGEVTTDYPVTLIQGHSDVIIHTDETTAQPILTRLK